MFALLFDVVVGGGYLCLSPITCGAGVQKTVTVALSYPSLHPLTTLSGSVC